MRKLLLATLLSGVATPAYAQEASPYTGFRLEPIVADRARGARPRWPWGSSRRAPAGANTAI